jgi:hypothetical protein
MAQAVYSLRIFASGGLSPGAGTVGPIVPTGLVYIVRDIDAFDDSGGSSDNMVVFNQTLGLLVSWQGPSLAAAGGYQWRGRQVYNEGEQVGVRSFVGTWSVAISGYQLTLP